MNAPTTGPIGKRALHFKIRDIYKDAGKYDDALEELRALTGME